MLELVKEIYSPSNIYKVEIKNVWEMGFNEKKTKKSEPN